MIGKQISHYQIIEELGRGGMGVVYKARDLNLDRTLALKFVPQDLTDDEEANERFKYEAKAASSLEHPNIGAIYEIDQTADGSWFIAMSYYEGETLADKISRGALPIEEAVSFTLQIARGLKEAHARGIVHRDVKPSNIIITNENTVKVIDFGIAKLLGRADITKTGSTLGTIAYMSPEQVQGKAVDHRTDIWSLGVIMYEMLAGRQPFRGEYDPAIMYEILGGEPQVITEFRNDVPASVVAVLEKALAKDADQRYASFDDFIRELAPDGVSDSNVIVVEQKADRPKAIRMVALVTSATVLVVLGFLYFRQPSAPEFPDIRLENITSFVGEELSPSFSPDGNQICFARKAPGWFGPSYIYVQMVGVSGTLAHRLTSQEAYEFVPSWSPDGKWIAFMSETSDGPEIVRNLSLVTALGDNVRPLVNSLAPTVHAEEFTAISWTPDGKHVVFTDEPDSLRRIFIVNIDNGQVRPLTEPVYPQQDALPAVSPDGKWLAFFRGSWRLESGDIYIQSLAGGGITQVTHINLSITGLAWTSDSRAIRYKVEGRVFRKKLASRGLWQVSIPDGKPVKLPFGSEPGGKIAISPDGSRMAIEKGTPWGCGYWRYPITLDQEGSEGERILASSGVDHLPDYSPDGSQIAFYSDRSGVEQIWVCDSDGHNAQQLTFLENPRSGTPTWSPDGKHIAFDSWQDDQSDILVIDRDGSGLQKIGTPEEIESVPDWFGESLIFWSHGGSGGTYRTSLVNPLKIEPLWAQDPGPMWRWTTSDGKWLYYELSREKLKILRRKSSETGEDEFVYDFSGDPREWINVAVFDDGFYFHGNPQDLDELHFYNLETKQTTLVGRMDVHSPSQVGNPYFCWFVVSPDRKYLLHSVEKHEESDILLVENLKL